MITNYQKELIYFFLFLDDVFVLPMHRCHSFSVRDFRLVTGLLLKEHIAMNGVSRVQWRVYIDIDGVRD